METSNLTAEANMRIREATVADLAAIMRHRRGMFIDIGCCDNDALDAMEDTSAPFIKAGLEKGSFRAWLADVNGNVVAVGGLVIVDHPSAPNDPRPQRAWILNMYTEPQYRHRGYAKAIIEAIIAWCRVQGFISVSLHASDAGRHLYEVLGFTPTNEMRLVFK
jgi:GNAT superfamily N-acetyltransferase